MIIGDIEFLTLSNVYYRHVLYTTKQQQLVLMSLTPNEHIGFEYHDGTQFIRVEKGRALVILNEVMQVIEDNDFVVIPENTLHNIVNIGNEDLKLYTIYSPPQHPDQLIEEFKS